MLKISAEKTSFFYFTSSEQIRLVEDQLPLKVPRFNQLELRDIYHCQDIRLVLFQSFISNNSGHLYWLFWKDSLVPLNIDSLVFENNLDLSEYFVNSVKTVYQKTHCRDCGKIHDTLVIPTGDPYPGAPGLLEKKIEIFTYLRCPICNSGFGQLVVKII